MGRFLLPLLFLGLSFVPVVTPIWTQFDLVRKRIDAWGSDKNTSYTRISSTEGNGPVVPDDAYFGHAVADIGDLDGDGCHDLAVGAPMMVSTFPSPLSSPFSLPYTISLIVAPFHLFFSACVPDTSLLIRLLPSSTSLTRHRQALEVNGTMAPNVGAIYILFMNINGTVKSHRLINTNDGGGPQTYANVRLPPCFPPHSQDLRSLL